MITRASTLEDICYAVSRALDAGGITAVLTGGSAAAVYAPHAYTSLDADFVVDDDYDLTEIARALAPLGFSRPGDKGRIFGHPSTRYTVDFPKGPLSVGGEYVTETATIQRGDCHLRILTRTDCIRDRLAHFYFWNDYTALTAAVDVAAQQPEDVDWTVLRGWTKREGDKYAQKFQEFERRLDVVLSESRSN